MMLGRLIRHLLLPDWWRRRRLHAAALQRIRAAVAEAESGRGGELRVAIEASLELAALLRGTSARARALEVFASLEVWDTEENNGVLLYVLLADRDVEIVVDRGIARRVAQAEWEAICQDMEALFRAGRHEEALLTGVRQIGALLAVIYPVGGEAANQLPDSPVLLR